MSDDRDRAYVDALLQGFDYAAELRDVQRTHEKAMHTVFAAVIEVMDSFDRVLSSADPARASGSAASIEVDTVRLLARQLEHVLTDSGVSPASCLGQEADPRQHEIVSVVESDAHEDGAIVEVVGRGYQWNGRVLRRPRVVVARSTREDGRESDRH
jgi:molecular chaperone GrpE